MLRRSGGSLSLKATGIPISNVVVDIDTLDEMVAMMLRSLATQCTRLPENSLDCSLLMNIGGVEPQSECPFQVSR